MRTEASCICFSCDRLIFYAEFQISFLIIKTVGSCLVYLIQYNKKTWEVPIVSFNHKKWKVPSFLKTRRTGR